MHIKRPSDLDLSVLIYLNQPNLFKYRTISLFLKKETITLRHIPKNFHVKTKSLSRF